ncbi:Gfo/Idh/MocA family oxidoreductase [Actinacidiphila oryziradicis]|uniref:Gfo/Idh/MocA family protein n=1 Tax=Actinacidiphila oryziradicis TaxID=2571141 RepID=UPI0023F23350|nr:Gfo/Idh/MocA family oxidoreductase [Actinacidiphila oryziradicis]MCW2875077.1 dehydrogenase [Actinacidiphila oryziradicis]
MVGHAFMGTVHSQAWRTVNHAFDLPAQVELAAVCGRDHERVAAAAQRLGWDTHLTDWRELVARDDIDVIDICTPGDSHAKIAIAALEAGKHVLCEKPLANSVEEARAMVAAADKARQAGVRSACGFNYRRVPALSLLRNMIEGGRLGRIRHVRAAYLQDWITDPDFPLVWRLRKEVAGSGALGDIGAHIIDLAQYLTGDRLTGVCGLSETFVKERPLPGAPTGGLSAQGADGAPRGEVTVDDASLFLGRFARGALASFEATRFATGRRNALRLEINGSLGSAAFDLERLNELEFLDATQPVAEQGFRRILVTEPEHPYMAAWWPPGHIIGYEHTFTHEVRDLVEAIVSERDPRPSFADALQVQLVLDAVERSAAAGSAWTPVPAGDDLPATA